MTRSTCGSLEMAFSSERWPACKLQRKVPRSLNPDSFAKRCGHSCSLGSPSAKKTSASSPFVCPFADKQTRTHQACHTTLSTMKPASEICLRQLVHNHLIFAHECTNRFQQCTGFVHGVLRAMTFYALTRGPPLWTTSP